MNYYPPHVVIPVYAVFTAIGLFLTALRFWTRYKYRTSVGPDDWLILGGAVVVSTCAAIQFYNAIHGNGGDAIDEDDAERAAIIEYKVDLAMVVIEKPAFGFIKLSLLFFYKRIFDSWPSFRKINWFFIGLTIVWTVAFAFGDLFVCGSQIQYEWAVDQTTARDHCGDKGLLLLLFAITSVIGDLLVLGLPIFYIRRLQMPSSKKWASTAVFLLGFLSTMAGVLRTIFLSIAYPMGRMSWGYTPPPEDKTPLVLEVFNPTFWAMTEMLLGLWAANLPPLGPIFLNLHIVSSIGSVYRKLSSSYGSSQTRSSEKENWPSSAEHISQQTSHRSSIGSERPFVSHV